MSAYIKLSTGEYPRYVGDIALDPIGIEDYSPVEWVDYPVFDMTTQKCVEGKPIFENGRWKMTWAIVDKTPHDIEFSKKMKEKYFSEEIK